MCTVTFIPTSFSDFVLTSNRDESPDRNTFPPALHEIKGATLLFPKDEVAGGTWFGVSDHQRLICLLNGGFKAHERADEYRMSRGIIVTDLLASEDAVSSIEAFDFNGIEPFTIIMIEWKTELQLFELVWDGSNSFFTEKPLAPHIWSSSLLYSEGMKKERESWFSDFIFQHLKPTKNELLHFHKTAGNGSSDTNLVMDRGFVRTKSITQFSKAAEAMMRYEDLQTQNVREQIF